MTDYALPNGKTLTGLSDGYTPDEIKKYAITKGYATEADYNVDRKTSADWYSTLGEFGGSVAGAAAGASIGTAFLPVGGTIIGGIIGGGIGAFTGRGAGEIAEAKAEGRSIDPTTIASTAGKAAGIDMAFGLGFGAVGSAVKAIASPLVRILSPSARASAGIDVAANLQPKLAPYGSTLLPSQIGDGSMFSRAAETYAGNSIAFAPEFERIIKGFDQYAMDATQSVLSSMAGKSREEVGIALRQLSDDTQKAVGEVVDPLYKAIDVKGGLTLLSAPLKQQADAMAQRFVSGGVGRMSSSGNAAYNLLKGLPDEMSPAVMTQQIRPLISSLEMLEKRDNSGQTGAMLSILKSASNTFDKVPMLVDASSLAGRANAAAIERIGANGMDRVSGEYKAALEYLKNTRPKMSFVETRKELSYLKSKLRDMGRSATPDSGAEALYAGAVATLESAMDTAAKKFDPNLYAEYRYVSDFYKNAEQSIHSPFMQAALRKNDLAKVGDMLTTVGSVTPIKELDELVKLADSLGVVGGQSVREGLTRNYLESVFAQGDVAALQKFNNSMVNPKFRDTFNTIVPANVAKNIETLAREADILSTHLNSAGSNIAVRGREIGSLTSPFNPASWVYGLLPDLVGRKISNEAITKKIGAIKAVNAGIANGNRASEYALKTLGIAPSALTTVGIGVGASTNK